MSQESSTRGYDLISDHFADFELMDANGDGFVTMLESDTYHFNKLNEGMPGATISACGAPSGYLLMTSDIDCNHKMSLGEFALRLMEPFEITLNKRNLDFIASHGPIYQEINNMESKKQKNCLINMIRTKTVKSRKMKLEKWTKQWTKQITSQKGLAQEQSLVLLLVLFVLLG